jgi:transcriptional regulator with XRE-family HTH domain
MSTKPREPRSRRAAIPVTRRNGKSRADELDSGLALLVDIFKRKRRRRRMSVASLANRAQVPVRTIQRLESYRLNSVGLQDLLAIGTALGSKLTVELAPVRPKLPKTNAEILREFNALVKSPNCNPFVRNQPDKEHHDLCWDIVGDKKRNRLFVVVENRKKKLRFAKVTDEPGGWSIAGQIFGIDAETNAIAKDFSDQLYKEHRADLVDLPNPRKADTATE